LNLRRRTVNLRRPERARNEGTTGPEQVESLELTENKWDLAPFPDIYMKFCTGKLPVFCFLVPGFKFGVQSSGLRVSGFGFRVSGRAFRVSGFGLEWDTQKCAAVPRRARI